MIDFVLAFLGIIGGVCTGAAISAFSVHNYDDSIYLSLIGLAAMLCFGFVIFTATT